MKKLLFVLAFLSASGAAYAGTLPLTWTFQSSDAANTSASGSGGSLDLSVFRNNWVLATADLGSLTGSIVINFDFTTSSQGWWEVPFASIKTNGGSPISVSNCTDATLTNSCTEAGQVFAEPGGYTNSAFPMTAYGSNSGSLTRTFAVSGPTQIAFGIIPSVWASNGDHYNTYLTLRNISVSTVPEPATFALMFGGLFGALTLRRKVARAH